MVSHSFQGRVSVPEHFPDSVSIQPNKLRFISVLVREDQGYTTLKWFFYFWFLSLLRLPGWLDSHKSAWLLWLNC